MCENKLYEASSMHACMVKYTIFGTILALSCARLLLSFKLEKQLHVDRSAGIHTHVYYDLSGLIIIL